MQHDELSRCYPILSRHWGLSSEADEPPSVLDRRLQRDIEKLHRLGPRAIYHLLDEIGCRHSCCTFIESRASRYAELDPAAVRQLGGDRFPQPRLPEVA